MLLLVPFGFTDRVITLRKTLPESKTEASVTGAGEFHNKTTPVKPVEAHQRT